MKDIAVSIHQPQYLPYLGYIHKMKLADVFVFLDDVQFKKNEWQNRNRVKGTNGQIIWLTIPVLHNFGQKINEVVIKNSIPWQKQHRNTLKTYYSKAQHFHMIEKFNKLWSEQYEKLVDANIDSVKILAEIFEVKSKFILSSSLRIEKTKTERLVAICKELGGKIYISGVGAREYLDESAFAREGIEIVWQKFEHPVYPQLHGEFIPNLSAIDLVLNVGEKAKDMI
ncbi:MAG: WbqC family protein [Candidatus Calescibacterium sp.]|nr:WbqC family protein [Candidatus Calescibacterium sp.]MCX7733585.1 WbqC family protein [bacterium]